MEDSTQSTSPLAQPGALHRFFKVLWWQHVIAFSWHFRRHLLWTAIFFLLFGLINVPILSALHSLHTLGETVVEAGPFLLKLGLMTLGLVISAIFFLCGVFFGVLKLTAFTRAFLYCPLPADITELKSASYKMRAHTTQAEAIVAMSHHKAYLAQCWLLAAFAMAPPFIVLAFCSFAVMFNTISPEQAGSLPIQPNPSLTIYFLAGGLISSIALNNYSIVTLAVTSTTNRTVGDATARSLMLTLTSAPLLTVVSTFVLISTSLITLPREIFSFINQSSSLISDSIPVAIASEFWQVLSGIMVYPVGTAILTEVVRDAVFKDAPPQPVGGEGEVKKAGEATARSAELTEPLEADQQASESPQAGNRESQRQTGDDSDK